MPAVQLYSVRDQFHADRREVFDRVAGIGFGAVEHFDPLSDPDGFRALADEFGLTVFATHGPALAQSEAVFEAAQIIGTETVIVPFLPPREFADQSGVQRCADRLNELSVAAARHGLRVGYHNHHFELANRIAGRPALEVLADLLAPEVVLEVDVYWAAVGGVDVPQLLHRLAERVVALHVKDGPATLDDPMTAVGAGSLPIAEILAAAPDPRRIVELDRCATDIWQALTDSYKYLTAREPT